MLGKMPSHHQDEAFGSIPISSINSRTSPRVFPVLLTVILPWKCGNTNLVNTVSLINNGGIFFSALNIQFIHGNIQITYKPSKRRAITFPHRSFQSYVSSPAAPVECGSKHVCCPTTFTSEHLTWTPLINKWSYTIMLSKILQSWPDAIAYYSNFFLVFDDRKSPLQCQAWDEAKLHSGTHKTSNINWFAINSATYINAFECLIELRKHLHCSLFFWKKTRGKCMTPFSLNYFYLNR